jgi:acyl carrier protein
MTTTNNQVNDRAIKDTVIQAINEVTGVDTDEITIDAHIEDDLGIDLVSTFPKIMQEINFNMNSQLPLRDPKFVEDLKDAETVGELVDVISAELEY